MSMKPLAVNKGEKLWIHSPATGWMEAWADEDKGSTGIAYFSVTINSETFPGISQMTINLNQFDVYMYDDVDALKKIASKFVKPWITR